MEILLNDLNLAQKNLLKQITLIALGLILVTIGCLWVEKFTIDYIYDKGFSGFRVSAKLSTDLSRVHANLYRIPSMTASGLDKQEIANLADQQLVLINADVALVKNTLNTSLTAEEKKYYQGIMDNLIEYQKMSTRVIKLSSVGTGSVYLSAADDKFQTLNQLLSELTKYESNVAEKEYTSFNRNYYIIVIALLLLFGGAIYLIAGTIKKYIDNILISVKESTVMLREIAEGKYPRNIELEADDEIGELIQAINAVRYKMGTSGSVHQEHKPPAQADVHTKSLSGMIRNPAEQAKATDKLVTSTKDAIDKLRDIT